MEEENQGGNNMARPTKEIDKGQFEGLCRLQCTLEEMAGFFRCDRDTIAAWCKRTYDEGFSAVFKKYSQEGKISLRRTLFRQAETKPVVAIFLAKNILGMADKLETNITSDEENKRLTKEWLEFVKNGKEEK